MIKIGSNERESMNREIRVTLYQKISFNFFKKRYRCDPRGINKRIGLHRFVNFTESFVNLVKGIGNGFSSMKKLRIPHLWNLANTIFLDCLNKIPQL